MSVNQFKPRKFEDFEILDGAGNKIGEVRVKASGILWGPKGSHKWFSVNLKEFADFMERNGNPQNKQQERGFRVSQLLTQKLCGGAKVRMVSEIISPLNSVVSTRDLR